MVLPPRVHVCPVVDEHPCNFEVSKCGAKCSGVQSHLSHESTLAPHAMIDEQSARQRRTHIMDHRSFVHCTAAIDVYSPVEQRLHNVNAPFFCSHLGSFPFPLFGALQDQRGDPESNHRAVSVLPGIALWRRRYVSATAHLAEPDLKHTTVVW